jgi:hypothetical protein
VKNFILTLLSRHVANYSAISRSGVGFHNAFSAEVTRYNPKVISGLYGLIAILATDF